MRKPTFVILTFVAAALVAAPQLARAHCCHDSRTLGIAAQFQSGMHSLADDQFEEDDGLTDDSVQADQPDFTQPLRNRGGLDTGTSVFGQMHGNNVGNYGGGSIGQRGPGGLGAMTGNGLGGPVRVH